MDSHGHPALADLGYEAGRKVYALNPMAVACYRERHAVSRKKVFAACLFTEARAAVLAAGIDEAADTRRRARARDHDRLRRQVADLTRRQDNILRHAEEADPADPFGQGLRDRFNDLDTQRRLLDRITELETTDDGQPAGPCEADLDLVELLPHVVINLRRAPLSLQTRLYELTRLAVTVDYETDHATVGITLPADGLDELGCDRTRTAPTHRGCGPAPRAAGRHDRFWCGCCECPGRGRHRWERHRSRSRRPVGSSWKPAFRSEATGPSVVVALSHRHQPVRRV